MSGTKKTKTTAQDKPEFVDYVVGFDTSNRSVDIYLKDNVPQDALKIVGEFTADPIKGLIKGEDDFDGEGDGVLVGKARQIIKELGVTDTAGFVYRDRASNAPEGSSYVMTHDEREQAVRENKSPADVQKEIGENIDEAAKKHDK